DARPARIEFDDRQRRARTRQVRGREGDGKSAVLVVHAHILPVRRVPGEKVPPNREPASLAKPPLERERGELALGPAVDPSPDDGVADEHAYDREVDRKSVV